MFTKNVQDIFLFIIVILLANILCLDESDVKLELNVSRIWNSSDQTSDSIIKSDHNFYSPDSPALQTTKSARKCSNYFHQIISSKRQCSLFKNACYKNSTSSLNMTDQFEKPLQFLLKNDSSDVKISFLDEKLNVSSQNETVNQPRPNDSVVQIMSNIKSSPVTSQEMLSFEEWRRKISEQMEKSSSQPNGLSLEQLTDSVPKEAINNNNQKVIVPTNRARNFASHECGAKIVGSNTEANFGNRVLNEQLDEYMLNPCKTKNWFVIELCETIQPQYLELANFELYSSIPKEFSVYASEHYPNRNEWSLLGTFTANDVRSLQGFKLNNNGFVKFVKIELLSYYGSEHYCPISLIRVFGTNLFDEVEIQMQNPEAKSIDFAREDEGNALFEEPLQITSPVKDDILNNAKTAVYNLLMKALNFNLINRILENLSTVKDLPSGNFDVIYQSRVIQLFHIYQPLLAQCESIIINRTANLPSKCTFFRLILDNQLFDMLYTQYFINKYISNQLFLQCGTNETYFDLNTTSLAIADTLHSKVMGNLTSSRTLLSNLSHQLNERNQTLNPIIEQLNTSIASSIVSSFTLNENLSLSNLETTLATPTILQTVIYTLPPPIQTTATVTLSESISSSVVASNESTVDASKFESITLPLEYEADYQALSSFSGQSKEAVIIRLTNRIKNLEKNISLMSTYLENLSVRYRMQMEEMLSIFNRTIDHLNSSAIAAAEKDQKQQEFLFKLEKEIVFLNQKMFTVTDDVAASNWLYIRVHLILMTLELTFVAILCTIFYFVFRSNLSSLIRSAAVSSGDTITTTTSNNSQTTCDNPKLELLPPIPPSPTSKKLHHIRSKSLSDFGHLLNYESFSENMKLAPDEVKPLIEPVCDTSNKENQRSQSPICAAVGGEPSMTELMTSTSPCVQKILKVIN